MTGLGAFDVVALLFFVSAWLGYHFAVERGPRAVQSLTTQMNARRRRWFEQALARENRIIDAQVLGSLQNGTAFFASTSLLAVGGAISLMGVTDQVVQVTSDLPFVTHTTRAIWEVKVIGLAVILAYAFFKFAWSYRLFNYNAILLGALPIAGHADEPASKRALDECVGMNIVAGRHFNRGQRAFFFALAYLGWFVGPAALAIFTSAVLLVMWRRQLGSDSLAALGQKVTAE